MKQIIINYLFVFGLPIIVGLGVRILFQRFNKAYFTTVAFAVLTNSKVVVYHNEKEDNCFSDSSNLDFCLPMCMVKPSELRGL